jgi:hypothetical protein
MSFPEKPTARFIAETGPSYGPLLVSVTFDGRSGLEFVHRAAIRALAFAVMVDRDEDARMRRPDRHLRIRAVCRQVLAVDFDVAHDLLGCVHGIFRE